MHDPIIGQIRVQWILIYMTSNQTDLIGSSMNSHKDVILLLSAQALITAPAPGVITVATVYTVHEIMVIIKYIGLL